MHVQCTHFLASLSFSSLIKCYMYITISYFNSSGDFSPFQKFLVCEDLTTTWYINHEWANSALYAQECQFSIVGLVTGQCDEYH